jgi:GNAT superfamily N-acetyltransferase
MRIRPAHAEDAEAVQKMAADLAASYPQSTDAFRAAFAACLAEDHAVALVAEKDGGAIGYLLGSDGPVFYANGRAARVEELYVLPARRGSGVGRALMGAFERWAVSRGAAVVTACTRRAAAFYAALGYEETATCFRAVPGERGA